MKFLYNIDGAQNNLSKKINVYRGSTAAVAVGAVLIKGVTAGTNNNAAILSQTSTADVIGVLEQAIASGVADFSESTPVNNLAKVGINPLAVYLAEYDQTSTSLVTVTSASSGTTINCTSIGDISGGWVYVVSGTGAGQLRYVSSQSSNTLTLVTALTTALDTTSKFIKIMPQLSETIDALDATFTKIKSAAANGSLTVRVIGNFMRYSGQPITELDPTVNDGLTGLNSLNAHFYAAIMFLDHYLNVSA